MASEPWLLWHDIHAGAREHELTMRRMLGFRAVRRGSSDRNTAACLQAAIPVLYERVCERFPDRPLCRRPGKPHGYLLTDLLAWSTRAWRLTDPGSRPTPLRGHSCPVCGARSLVNPPGTDLLVCAISSCTTAEGERLTWPIYDPITPQMLGGQ